MDENINNNALTSASTSTSFQMMEPMRENALSRNKPHGEHVIDFTNTYNKAMQMEETDPEAVVHWYEMIEEDNNDLVCVKSGPKENDIDSQYNNNSRANKKIQQNMAPIIYLNEPLLQRKHQRTNIRKKTEHLSNLGEDFQSSEELEELEKLEDLNENSEHLWFGYGPGDIEFACDNTEEEEEEEENEKDFLKKKKKRGTFKKSLSDNRLRKR